VKPNGAFRGSTLFSPRCIFKRGDHTTDWGSLQPFDEMSIAIYPNHPFVIKAALIVYAKQQLAIQTALALAGFDALVAADYSILLIFTERSVKQWSTYQVRPLDQSIMVPQSA
jgi:hypothetical protein